MDLEENPLVDEEMIDDDYEQGIPSQPVHVPAEEIKGAIPPKEEAKK